MGHIRKKTEWKKLDNEKRRDERQEVDFINVLLTAFKLPDPKSIKKTVKLSIFFTLLGSMSVKLYVERWWNWERRSISPTFVPNFFALTSWEAFLVNGVWQTANRFGKWGINLANLTSPHMGKFWGRMLVKLNGEFFCQKMCDVNISLGAQSLVKLTPWREIEDIKWAIKSEGRVTLRHKETDKYRKRLA